MHLHEGFCKRTTFGVIASLDLQDEVTTISVILTSQSSISRRFTYFALKSGNKMSELWTALHKVGIKSAQRLRWWVRFFVLCLHKASLECRFYLQISYIPPVYKVSTAVSVFACFLEVVHFSKDPLWSEAICVLQFYSPHREGTLQSSML